MEEAGLEEGLRDSVTASVSALDKAKMFPAEELKGKEPEAGELENCHSAHDYMPYSMSLAHCDLWCLDLRPREPATRRIPSISSLLTSLDIMSGQPIDADIKPPNGLLKDSRPNQVDMSSSSDFPPGFRFHPSDQELICHYLTRKHIPHSMHYLEKEHVPSTFLAFDNKTWSLPDICQIPKREWYFFSFRERKYPTTSRTFHVRNAMDKHRDGYSQHSLTWTPLAKLVVEYMNSGRPSLATIYASHCMKTRVKAFIDVQSYKDVIGKISNWPLNIFQRGCRKSSELQKVWPRGNKIVSWSSAAYVLLLIFSLYATTTLLSSLNFQGSLLDVSQTGKQDLHTNQFPNELEGDLIRPAGSLYDQQTSKKSISWTFSSFSFLLFPATLLVTILLLELNLESRMSSESHLAACGTNSTTCGSGFRGHKQKNSITKGIVVSKTTASYALLLIALLSAVISLLVALNFRGSISDGSYPGSCNLYKGWLFISINSTIFFTSGAVMVILMHELSLGIWQLISTLSMLGSYACLVMKVVPLHGMPLILLGIPSTLLARALRNVALS